MREPTQAKTAGIVASYNQAPYIEEAVTSLATQVDELIVVDDCSEDDSVDRVSALRLPNVHILQMQQRSGVSEACNAAVELSNAEIVVLQGGDDRSLAGRVQQHIEDFTEPGIVVSSSLPVIINARGERVGGTVAQEFATPEPWEDTLFRLVFSGNYVCAPAAAMRRADYLALGGYPVGIDLLQDYGLWLKALSVGQIKISAEPHVEYRKHATNTSRSYVGVDSHRQRRHAAELEYLVTAFLEAAPDPVLDRLNARAGLDIRPSDQMSRLASRALLLLSHDNRVLRRRGLHLIFTMLEQAGSWGPVAQFSITPAVVEHYAQAVDHESGGDVAQALLTATKLAQGARGQCDG